MPSHAAIGMVTFCFASAWVGGGQELFVRAQRGWTTAGVVFASTSPKSWGVRQLPSAYGKLKSSELWLCFFFSSPTTEGEAETQGINKQLLSFLHKPLSHFSFSLVVVWRSH